MDQPRPDEMAALAAATEQPQIKPMQELHSTFQFDVQTGPDGSRLLVFESVAPRKTIVFMFGKMENAEALGRKLIAPGVVVPSTNGHGPH